MCRKCGERVSTGVLIELCDPCFDEFEAKINSESERSASGRYVPSDRELEYLHDSQVDRSKS